jgi:hypothetical protein
VRRGTLGRRRMGMVRAGEGKAQCVVLGRGDGECWGHGMSAGHGLCVATVWVLGNGEVLARRGWKGHGGGAEEAVVVLWSGCLQGGAWTVVLHCCWGECHGARVGEGRWVPLDRRHLYRRCSYVVGSFVELGNGVDDAFTGVALQPVGIVGVSHCPAFCPKPGLEHLRSPPYAVEASAVTKDGSDVRRIVFLIANEFECDGPKWGHGNEDEAR